MPRDRGESSERRTREGGGGGGGEGEANVWKIKNSYP